MSQVVRSAGAGRAAAGGSKSYSSSYKRKSEDWHDQHRRKQPWWVSTPGLFQYCD